jgi:urea transport system substrate-binding protein
MRLWIVVSFIALFLLFSLYLLIGKKDDTIKIGLLYSKSGTMATEERVIAQMVHFAVDEINKNGGIENKKIQIIEFDGASDPQTFAKGAEHLASLGVKSVFGCWTSASRVAVKPVVEKNDMILLYPVQFEGFEESKNIIYLGSSVNQQINPTLSYIKKHYGESVYIVGSDYIYPQTAAIYIKEQAKKIPMNIAGSSFEPLGSGDFSKAIEDIKKLKPKAIINLINGESNIAFFEQLYQANLFSKEFPVFSQSMDESTIKHLSSSIGVEKIAGHYLTNSYLMSIDTEQNREFLTKLKKSMGEDFLLTDAGIFAYIGVKLWENGYKHAKLYQIPIKKVISTQSISSAVGPVYIDEETNYTYKNIHIGKISQESNTHTVWSSQKMIKPFPYPTIHTKEEWQKLLHKDEL